MSKMHLLAGASAAAVLAIGTSASAQLIDDFSDTDLSEYTFTKVLDQGDGTTNVSFSSPSGALQVNSAGSSGAEQVLFLRDDFALDVGERLLADVDPSTGWDRDLGIAVAATDTPTGLGSTAGDVRSDYVEVSFRSDNQVVSIAVNDTTEASGQEFATTDYNGEQFNTTDPLSLYIARLSANEFEVGWFQNGTFHALTNNGGVINPYVVDNADVGLALGFYADVRADLAASPVTLDNLRIEAIPEPASLGLLGLGGLAMLRRRRA